MDNSLYRYNAVSCGGYDGDSCRADISLGFNQWVLNRELRLYGIDTPEIRGRSHIEKRMAKAAKAQLYTLIPEGQEFILQSIKDDTGKYGRVLGRIHVETASGWICANDHLIEIGLAQPYSGRGKRIAWDVWYGDHKAAIDPLLDRFEF